MAIWNRFDALREQMDAIPGVDTAFGLPFDSVVSPTRARSAGQELILAGSNNYLGCSFFPEVIDAAVEATKAFGTGTTGLRLANGTFAWHKALESELAACFGRRHAIVFSTGYQANLGVLSGLTGPQDTIFINSECHASIIDGCRLSGAKSYLFKHNDADHLRRALGRSEASDPVVIVEGIYSMSGDRAALCEIVVVCQEHRALLIVDEAHSFGVLGRTGRGLAEECEVEDGVDLIVGTFSKSLGALGGFVVGNAENLVPSLRRAVLHVLRLLAGAGHRRGARRARSGAQRRQLRQTFWRNARLLAEGLAAAGCAPRHGDSPVMCIKVGEVARAFGLWRALLDKGIYVNLVVPPAAPANAAMLRLSVSAAHSEADIRAIVEAMASVFAEFAP